MIKEFELDARIENIPSLTDSVDAILEEAGIGMKMIMQIDIALDEIFSNIAKYAYAPGTGKAVVRVETFPDYVQISFIDCGVPFDPLNVSEPDVTMEAEKRNIGGLGIFLVRKTMDEVKYLRRDGRNILMLRKKI